MFDMYNFAELKNDAVEKLAKLGYDEVLHYNYVLKFNMRAKGRYGRCSKLGKDEFEIQLNYEYAQVATLKDVIETVIHEVMHSIDGCMNHGRKWKYIAYLVRNKYGHNIERTGKCEEYRALKNETIDYKYMVKCNRCGVESKYQKKSKLINHPEKYRCGNCRGTLSVTPI
jgi:predicted SprT family Zn-dependent metalloprotease